MRGFKATFFVITSLACFASGLPGEIEYYAMAVKVNDGDTFTIRHDGGLKKIRIHGIDAPEGSQAHGNISKAHLRRLIEGKDLRIRERYKDSYGRTVAQAFMSGDDVGLELIRAGMAWHYARYSRDRAYANAEQAARKNAIGLWGSPAPIPPWRYRNWRTRNDARRARASTTKESNKNLGRGGYNMSLADPVATAPEGMGGFLNVLLHFIYTIAHQIGVGIVKLFGLVFGAAKFPMNLVDPLGFLVVLTLFALLLTLAKKAAWIVLAIGWGFMLIRILMIIFGK